MHARAVGKPPSSNTAGSSTELPPSHLTPPNPPPPTWSMAKPLQPPLRPTLSPARGRKTQYHTRGRESFRYLGGGGMGGGGGEGGCAIWWRAGLCRACAAGRCLLVRVRVRLCCVVRVRVCACVRARVCVGGAGAGGRSTTPRGARPSCTWGDGRMTGRRVGEWARGWVLMGACPPLRHATFFLTPHCTPHEVLPPGPSPNPERTPLTPHLLPPHPQNPAHPKGGVEPSISTGAASHSSSMSTLSAWGPLPVLGPCHPARPHTPCATRPCLCPPSLAPKHTSAWAVPKP